MGIYAYIGIICLMDTIAYMGMSAYTFMPIIGVYAYLKTNGKVRTTGVVR